MTERRYDPFPRVSNGGNRRVVLLVAGVSAGPPVSQCRRSKDIPLSCTSSLNIGSITVVLYTYTNNYLLSRIQGHPTRITNIVIIVTYIINTLIQ